MQLGRVASSCKAATVGENLRKLKGQLGSHDLHTLVPSANGQQSLQVGVDVLEVGELLEGSLAPVLLQIVVLVQGPDDVLAPVQPGEAVHQMGADERVNILNKTIFDLLPDLKCLVLRTLCQWTALRPRFTKYFVTLQSLPG